MAGYCEHGNKPSDSAKRREYIDQLSEHQLLHSTIELLAHNMEYYIKHTRHQNLQHSLGHMGNANMDCGVLDLFAM
jgi:hypothetical protein